MHLSSQMLLLGSAISMPEEKVRGGLLTAISYEHLTSSACAAAMTDGS